MPRHTKKNKPTDYIEEHIVAYTHVWVPAGTPINGYSRDSEGNLLVNKRGYWRQVQASYHHYKWDPQAYMDTRFKGQQLQEVSQ
jgi:hypothetical protein